MNNHISRYFLCGEIGKKFKTYAENQTEKSVSQTIVITVAIYILGSFPILDSFK